MTGGGVVYGGSVLAAVVAGAVALFAPCCISVMLPTYFASSFHNRRVLVAMTFLFAGGVASVVLPIALGAALVQRLLVGQHTLIWSAGGALLLGLGGYTLAGGQLRLPMPGRPTKTRGRRAGPLAVWSLGVFSGAASACCAPVLAGVVALSGLAASFGRAVGLGGAYVFGMVAPLFLLALWWERHDWQTSRLLRPRSITWRIGPVRRTVSGTGLASGLLLVAMGGVTVWIARSGSPMAPPGGWQARLSAWLQHAGTVVVRALAWLPGWAAAVLLATAAGLLAWRALGQVGWRGASSSETDGIDFQEASDEHQDPQAVRPSTAARDRQT
jgi:cytochrome c-type biogenesis protein